MNTAATPATAVQIEDVLSQFHIEMLSEHAKKLYLAVWFRMKTKHNTQVWLTDDEASRRARILIRYIPAARVELANAGLLETWQGMTQWKYTFIEQYDPNEDTNENEAAQ